MSFTLCKLVRVGWRRRWWANEITVQHYSIGDQLIHLFELNKNKIYRRLHLLVIKRSAHRQKAFWRSTDTTIKKKAVARLSEKGIWFDKRCCLMRWFWCFYYVVVVNSRYTHGNRMKWWTYDEQYWILFWTVSIAMKEMFFFSRNFH